MKNFSIPILLGIMCCSFTIIPKHSTVSSNSAVTVVSHTIVPDSILYNNSANVATAIYSSAKLLEAGLSEEAFAYAWKGYQKLLSNNHLTRATYLTICDFSQSSSKKRLYIIDVINQKLITNTYVAHGKNSGNEFATRFSNTPESLQSSLGFYVTASTYIGAHGLSLRINGVDKGYNDKAFARTIVIHGAAYVDPARAKAGVFMGRSFGCPAVPQKESTQIITTIKDGTCLFIYHPGKTYLTGSKILNG